MLDRIPPDTLREILSWVGPLDPTWSSILRSNKFIGRIGRTVRRNLPIDPHKVASHGPAAIEYFIQLCGVKKFIGGYIYLSAEQFVELMKSASGDQNMFDTLILYRPDLLPIAWSADLDPGRCEDLVDDYKMANYKRWMFESKSRWSMYVNRAHTSLMFDDLPSYGVIHSVVKEEGLENFDDSVVGIGQRVGAGMVRSYIFNCISDKNVEGFIRVLFLSFRIDSAGEDVQILDVGFITFLTNYVVSCCLQPFVDVINVFCGINMPGEQYPIEITPLDWSNFPKYDNSWINSAGLENIFLGVGADKLLSLAKGTINTTVDQRIINVVHFGINMARL